MNKTKILKRILSCGKLYKEELENTNLLFIYGSESNPRYFETEFLGRHFLHLTGVSYINSKKAVFEGAPSYSVEFYEKVVSNKVSCAIFSKCSMAKSTSITKVRTTYI